MIYQKLTTGMGQCLLLIRKHADRDGFELWRRKERCWCYFNNVGAEYFKEFFDMRGELTDISEAEALELIKELRYQGCLFDNFQYCRNHRLQLNRDLWEVQPEF